MDKEYRFIVGISRKSMIAQEKTHEQIMDERNSAVGIRFDDTYIWITLADERVLGVPSRDC
jgi:hypothetical protein